MKKQMRRVYQKRLLFHEQKIWQQIPPDLRKDVIQLLTQMIREHYYRKEGSHVK